MSGKFKCKGCSRWLHYGIDDVVHCPSCGRSKVIDENVKIHKDTLERDCAQFPRPQATVSRALAYTSAIYRQATHNEPFDTGRIESTLVQRGEVAPQSVASKSSVRSRHARSFRGYNDSRPGLALIVAEGSGTGGPWAQVHLVFRGSRGDKAFDPKQNPAGAGWDTDNGQLQNVDWAANFTTSHVRPAWASDPVRIHQGFSEVYGSMRQDLHDELGKQLDRHPGASVVVSGHSLGAALAVVASHDLHCSGLCKPFCFVFNTPMVGNLHFALSYQNLIGCHWTLLAGEQGRFPRTLNFVRRSDPVSWGRHGFKAQNPTAELNRTKVANQTNIAVKALEAMSWATDKAQYFYQTPNVVRMNWLPVWSAHDYTATQLELTGRVLFR